jgi:hypothetical protein
LYYKETVNTFLKLNSSIFPKGGAVVRGRRGILLGGVVLGEGGVIWGRMVADGRRWMLKVVLVREGRVVLMKRRLELLVRVVDTLACSGIIVRLVVIVKGVLKDGLGTEGVMHLPLGLLMALQQGIEVNEIFL